MRSFSILCVCLCFGLCACASSSPSDEAWTSIQTVGGVDHFGLTVSKLEESKAFFVDALGFRVKGQDASYPAYFLTNGEATITLWAVKDGVAAVPFDRKQNVGLHHVALAVSK